jgi:hypothetical protein
MKLLISAATQLRLASSAPTVERSCLKLSSTWMV